MNVTRVAVVLGLGIFAASAGFVACSGDDSSTSVPRPDAGPDGTVDRDGGEDAGTDAFPEDARASDPKSLRCGNTRCNTDDQFCCVQDDGGAACASDSDGGACNGGTEIGCDEQADCDEGEVCCGTAKLGEVTVECAPPTSCNNPFENRRICKTDAECGDAGACVTQPCKGIIVSTCGGIPPSACTR
ncbi:hypothetical protein LZC95_12470 [Pendulispora brunnea]|uniref:Tryptophan synthase alpha chain n=1 Tax=Pendulispora brunnea TaxID=2905690 RepID=A0ABZ2KJ84_9BACT